MPDAILGARVKTVFAAENGCYGAKRITVELKDQADQTPANHKRVARVMRALKLFGYTEKLKVTTTVSDQKKPMFLDLVGRKFTAEKPNQVYVGDISYLPIADGSNMYLATVIDCYSRRSVGFAIADHMRDVLGPGCTDHGQSPAWKPKWGDLSLGSWQRLHLSRIPGHL